MKGVRAVLGGLRGRRVRLGGTLSTEARVALRAHRRQFMVLVGSLYVIVLAAVVIAIGAAARELPTEDGLEVFSAVVVVVVGGAMEFLRRCVREWSWSTLLMIVLDGATEADTLKVIEKVLESR